MPPIYRFLDYFFLIFHTCFTLFNIFGWIWRRTRKLHLLTVAATLFSWIILGFRYGFGFCFCTQWHWNVLGQLNRYPRERGYIEYLINRLTGVNISPVTAEKGTFIVMALIVVATVLVNARDWKRKKSK